MDPFIFIEHQKIAQHLKRALYQLMQDKFQDLLHYTPEKGEFDNVQIFFYIKGKEDTFHEFMFPGEGVFLTQENAHKVIAEMKQYDESLTDNLLMSYTVNETK